MIRLPDWLAVAPAVGGVDVFQNWSCLVGHPATNQRL